MGNRRPTTNSIHIESGLIGGGQELSLLRQSRKIPVIFADIPVMFRNTFANLEPNSDGLSLIPLKAAILWVLPFLHRAKYQIVDLSVMYPFVSPCPFMLFYYIPNYFIYR